MSDQVKRPAGVWGTSATQIADAVKLPGISAVVIWTGAANVLLLLFAIVVVRAMEPRSYGLFAALFGVAALFNVAFSGVQVSVAWTTAQTPPQLRSLRLRGLMLGTLGATFALLLGLWLVSPAIGGFLHTDDRRLIVAAAIFTAALLPWTVMLGVFQGSMRYVDFGILSFAHAATRVLALLVLLVGTGPGVVFLAMGVAVAPPLAYGSWLLYRDWVRDADGSITRSDAPTLLAHQHRHLGLAVIVALAVGFPTLGDVLLVRHGYDAYTAGLFAGAALTGRVVLFLALAVGAAAFPQFVVASTRERMHRLRQGVVAAAVLMTAAAGALSIAQLCGFGVVPTLDASWSITSVLYMLAAVLFGIGSIYALFNLALACTGYVLLIAIPCLVAQVVAPLVLAGDIGVLVITEVAIAAAFAVSSAAFTHRTARAPRTEDL